MNDKPEKHIKIDNAIHDLQLLAVRLANLLERIDGTVANAQDSAPNKPDPSLGHVLDTADARIKDLIDTANITINSIESKLF